MVELGIGLAATDGDAAAGRPLEPDQDVEERRLAAAGLTHDRDHLAGADAEVELPDRHHLVPGDGLLEAHAQPGDLDVGGVIHVRQRSMRVSTRLSSASNAKRMATRITVQANTSATENSSCARTRP